MRSEKSVFFFSHENKRIKGASHGATSVFVHSEFISHRKMVSPEIRFVFKPIKIDRVWKRFKIDCNNFI